MASELHPLRFELQIWLLPWSSIFKNSDWKFCSRLPCRYPKTWHWGGHFWLGILFFKCFYFWVKKHTKTCWLYKNAVFANWEKDEVSRNFLTGLYYWFLKLCTWIIWHSYFPSHAISYQKGSGWSGAKWVNSPMFLLLLTFGISGVTPESGVGSHVGL